MPSPTLTDKVAKMIRHDILVGNFAPSEKLVVADLKTRYDVGASPIREALVQLSWSKFVVVEPQKGCWVAPISTSELADSMIAYVSLPLSCSNRQLIMVMKAGSSNCSPLTTSYLA